MDERLVTLSAEPPKAIQTIGSLIIWLAVFVLFGNIGGILAYRYVNGGIADEETHHSTTSVQDPMTFIWQHYIEMGVAMVVIGIALMISGIFFKKRRKWANRLLSLLLVLLVGTIWSIMLTLSSSMEFDPKVRMLSFFPYLVALVYTIPLLLLLRAINRQSIIIHFE